ncbi:MAG: penicillin-binding protein activator [Spiribacter sp.]|nr:penicillin-binding protein activator [Spiribacter sp.]
MSLSRPAIALFAALLFIAGCTAVGPLDEDAVTRIESPRLDKADAALAMGDVTSSLTLLRMAARDAPEPAATGLKLEAALLALTMDDPQPARQLTDSRWARAGARNAAISTLIEARLAIRQDRANRVRAETLTEVTQAMPRRLRPYQTQTLAQLAAQMGDWQRALTYRLELADFDPPTDLARHNEAELWEGLMRAPLLAVQSAAKAAPEGIRKAWLQLATQVRQAALSASKTEDALQAWRLSHPQHPASQLLETRISAIQRAETAPPRSVAALLPLSGELAPAGQAIRRGLLAAHYAATNQRSRPTLNIIDVGPDGLPAPAAYQQAVAEGAQQVIGPLSKSAIRDLASSTPLSVPVLALNRASDIQNTPKLRQFGLAPEDDARAAAALARQLGYERMAVIASADDWGQRVTDAFSEAFTEQTGEIIELSTYADQQEDMSLPIRTLFQLDASEERHVRMQSVTGARLQFEDRRRQDMDGVFMAAFEPAARLIAPQIRFQRGIGLPVVATSQAYPQTASDQANKDMEAVMITRMPWLLDQDTNRFAERVRAELSAADTDQRAGQLVALGLDSYQLLGRLSILNQEPTVQFEGATGALRVDDEGRVRRHLLPTRVDSSGLRLIRMPALTGQPPYLP